MCTVCPMPRRLESAHKAQGCRTTALTASSHAKRSLTYRDTSRPAARRHGSAGVPARRYRRSREKRKPGCGTASPGSLHACEANLKAELSCFAAVRTSESEPRSLCRTRTTTDTPAPPPTSPRVRVFGEALVAAKVRRGEAKSQAAVLHRSQNLQKGLRAMPCGFTGTVASYRGYYGTLSAAADALA